MLLTTETTVRITNSNRKYYINKGYQVPDHTPHGEKSIIVRIDDLPNKTNNMVQCLCDECGKLLSMRYETYNHNLHDGKIYCHSCAMRILNSGVNNGFWNSNKTKKERENGRQYPEYTIFVKKVLARDNYSCVVCGSSRDLEVHHLNGYAWDVDNRTNEENAVSLCYNCHHAFHSRYGNNHNTREQFVEWSGLILSDFGKYREELMAPKKIICLDTSEVFNCTSEIKAKYGDSRSAVLACCLGPKSYSRYGHSVKSVHGRHYMYYEDYLSMSKQELQMYWNNWINNVNNNRPKGKDNYRSIPVVCLNTFTLFSNAIEAGQMYGVQPTNIRAVCVGKRFHAGKLSNTGEKLKWMYYDDYKK